MMRIVGSFGAMALVFTAALLLDSSPASADSPFSTLAGSWSGHGKIRLEGGKSESIRCRAYYTTSDGGSGLGMAIRCASASNKIEMRANLNYSNGAITGSWEERTYNAAGDVKGQATASKLTLRIAGGGLNGSMSVRLGGASQTVSISTTGSTFQGLDLSLSRG
jgi:hypothetical protein